MKASHILSFVLGAAAGAIIGILYAPHKGEDTRRMLKEKLREAQQGLSEIELDKLVDKVLGRNCECTEDKE